MIKRMKNGDIKVESRGEMKKQQGGRNVRKLIIEIMVKIYFNF